MEQNDQHKMNRRSFLKVLGAGTVATTGLMGCKNDKQQAYSLEPTGEMTYRKNPKTGEKVSLLGYGCMRWPMKKNANGKDEIDQAMVNELVDYALAHGVNYFDTSPAYLSNFDPSTYSREASINMYRQSFVELQTDYIDYMLLHAVGGGGMDVLHARYLDNGILDFLIEERAAGRIRNLGFSYHGDIKVFDYLLSRHDELKWDFVQIQLNYMDWLHAKEINPRNTNAEYLYGELLKRDIPAVIMEPLLGGRLAKLNDFLTKRLKERRPNETIASWAFRFAGTFPNVMTVLSGMTYMEHLVDNLKTYSPLEPCTEEEMVLLEDTARIMLHHPSVPCTACQYCMPCPYGINIPGIFSHYNKCITEGNVSENPEAENYRKARRAFLVGYDRSVPRLRQASHCIGCEQCIPHCPQGINIPEQMHRIDQFVESLKQSI